MAVLEFKQVTPATGKPSASISIRNLLYATDFSATSEAALPYAAAVCRKFGATLHIAHVVSDTSRILMTGGVDYVVMGDLFDDEKTAAQQKLQRVMAPLCDVPNRTYVGHGPVWPNLSGIVAENKIDLIVVGTHGRTGLGKLLLGSVAEDILRHAPCPVLTVGPGVCGRARLPKFQGNGGVLAPVELELRNILCAANLSPASPHVARVAISLAQEFKARLTLIHALENYSNLDLESSPVKRAAQQLQAAVPKDSGLAYAPETVMSFGPAWKGIVKTASERDIDLIVLGARPADGTTRVPWSTVHRVVAHASCPVLTVRAGLI